eukprot:519383-Pelagomonas_calceolata.AAC.2
MQYRQQAVESGPQSWISMQQVRTVSGRQWSVNCRQAVGSGPHTPGFRGRMDGGCAQVEMLPVSSAALCAQHSWA